MFLPLLLMSVGCYCHQTCFCCFNLVVGCNCCYITFYCCLLLDCIPLLARTVIVVTSAAAIAESLLPLLFLPLLVLNCFFITQPLPTVVNATVVRQCRVEATPSIPELKQRQSKAEQKQPLVDDSLDSFFHLNKFRISNRKLIFSVFQVALV